MTRRIKISLTVGGLVTVLPIVATVVVLFAGLSGVRPLPGVRREIPLTNRGMLIVDGEKRSRSEHGFSQRAGYRPAGSAEIEWFGDVSDGVEPLVYQSGQLVVAIDVPAAQLFVRKRAKKWQNFALVFPNDLGPFPISFYAEKSGLSAAEISRINELGGTRNRKYPTTYIQSFNPETRVLQCSYHVDNKSSWPLQLRLSDDGTHLVLLAIGAGVP